MIAHAGKRRECVRCIMVNVSRELMLITNLKNTAIHHKKYSNESNCGVSVYQLREAAQHIFTTVARHEITEAIAVINEMPLT